MTTAAVGKNYRTRFYNLEAIIAVGYRVRSPRGIPFRRWTTERLSEYLVKGFTMADVEAVDHSAQTALPGSTPLDKG